MADESIIKYSDIIGPDDTFDVIFQNIEKLKTELTELTEAFQKELSIIGPGEKKRLAEIGDELNKLAKTKKMLDNEEKKANRTKKRTQDLTDKQLEQLQREKIAQRERVQIAKQNAIINNSAEGSIERLRARLSKATIEWKRLSKNERENTDTGRRLVKTKKDLTNQLKRLEKATGDARRNVGNYSSALGRLGKIAVGVFLGRNIISGITRISNAIGSLIDKNKDTNESIGQISESFERFKQKAIDVGLNLLEKLAEPIIFVVNGLTKLIDTLVGGTGGLENFKTTSNDLAETTSKLNKELAKEQQQANELFNTLKNTNEGTEVRSDLIKQINEQYGAYLPNLLNEESSLGDIERAQKLVNEQLEKNFLLKIQQATLTDVITNKIKLQQKTFEDVQKQVDGLDNTFLSAFQSLQNGIGDSSSEVSKFLDAFNFAPLGTEVDSLLEQFDTFTDKQRELLKLLAGPSGVTGQFDDQLSVLFNNTQQLGAYNQKISEVQKSIGALSEDIIVNNKNTKDNTTDTNKNTKAISDNVNARESLIKKLAEQSEKLREARQKGDAKAEEDEQTKLIRLEQIRFNTIEKQRQKLLDDLEKTQQAQRQKLIDAGYKENSKQVLELEQKQNEELEQAQIESFKVQEQNLLFHFEELARIEKEGNAKILKEQDEKLKKEQEAERKAQEKIEKERQKQAEKDAKDEEKRLKERAQRFRDNVAETLNSISNLIVEANAKNVEIATSLVEEQADAVERQQERAEKGLTNTLAFEKQQLAERERERLEAEKRQKQALEFQTLLNLVSAYARSGDANALQRGLVDFGILKGLELIGFKDGGYTGDHATDQIAGVTHGREFVVTAEDTKKFGLVGKSGDQFGDTISDYFGNQSLLLTNPLEAQKNAFRTQMMDNDGQNINDLRNEIRDVRKAIEKMPKNDFDVLRMTDYFVEIANKVTSKRMTTVQKVRKKL